MESEMNRQQICAALSVSESNIRRLESLGLPFTPVGVRSHRYNLEECKTWLRTQYVPGATEPVPTITAREMWKMGKDFEASCRKVKLRVRPSWEKDEEFVATCNRAMSKLKPSENE